MAIRKLYVSVVFSVYNQERSLALSLLDIDRFLSSFDFLGEIIVVNNGSSDRSNDILRSFSVYMPHLKVVTLSTRQQHSIAMRRACDEVTGDWILTYDPRCSLDDFSSFQPFMEKGYQVIIGTRKLSDISFFDRCISKCVQSGLLLQGHIDCAYTMHCFSSVLRETVFNAMKVRGVRFDLEVFALATMLGYRSRYVELPSMQCVVSLSWVDYWRIVCNTLKIRFVLRLGSSSKYALMKQGIETRD